MARPFADLYRPNSLDEVVGQKHILGKNGLLTRLLDGPNLPNLIFYGPSGTGKTTVAKIIALKTNRLFYALNATTASTQDIKDITSKLDTLLAPNGILLYLDEIQYFTKKQQQLLLEYIENGSISLIASTTENPFFYIYNAILSRSNIFEFKPVESYEIEKALNRLLKKYQKDQEFALDIEKGTIEFISKNVGGDVRKAINSLELLISSAQIYNQIYHITLSDAVTILKGAGKRYDKDGDVHYDLLSAFQKSIRGSDPDASIYYLARLLSTGDILSPIRRLLVIATEDIGLAYPQAISIVKSCTDAALQLGLPEARIPLAQAVIFLATAPKSNSAIEAIDAALKDIEDGLVEDIPATIKDTHYQGAKSLNRGLDYLYPHAYKNHYVKQAYLPNKLKNKKYYQYQENKIETLCKEYWDAIKK